MFRFNLKTPEKQKEKKRKRNIIEKTKEKRKKENGKPIFFYANTNPD